MFLLNSRSTSSSNLVGRDFQFRNVTMFYWFLGQVKRCFTSENYNKSGKYWACLKRALKTFTIFFFPSPTVVIFQKIKLVPQKITTFTPRLKKKTRMSRCTDSRILETLCTNLQGVTRCSAPCVTGLFPRGGGERTQNENDRDCRLVPLKG